MFLCLLLCKGQHIWIDCLITGYCDLCIILNDAQICRMQHRIILTSKYGGYFNPPYTVCAIQAQVPHCNHVMLVVWVAETMDDNQAQGTQGSWNTAFLPARGLLCTPAITSEPFMNTAATGRPAITTAA